MTNVFNKLLKTTALAGILIFSTQVNAGLIDRGNGLIYDDHFDITWLADANYAQTSDYDADGLMTWDEAITWADQLVYEGYDDWRLASGEGCTGYYCTDSELGHLFYEDMGLFPGDVMSSNTLGLFTNIQDYIYWYGTELAPFTNMNFIAWIFDTSLGRQGYALETNSLYAWAVRSGDVAAGSVPEPGTLALFGLGLLGFRLRRRSR